MPVPRNRANQLPAILLATWLLVVAAPVLPALAGTSMVPLLVKTKGELTPDIAKAIAGSGVHVSYVWPEIRSMAIVASPERAATLAADSRVQFVEPDLEAGITGDPADTLGASRAPAPVAVPFSAQAAPLQTWNQDMANTPGPAETGAGVTVAVVDAGLPQNWQEFLPSDKVDVEHAAGFGPQGWGVLNNAPTAIGGVGGHLGLFPHGVAVSSVIVGFPSEFGFVAGAAPDARIIPIRVLNQFNFGRFSWFTAGILYAANLKASGAVPGPMVINFSIQAHGSSQILADAIDYVISSGVIFVGIAGNFHPEDTVSFPGRLPECITVGATGWTREGFPPNPWFFGDVPEHDASQVYVAPFSGREPDYVQAGSMVDVLAPGSSVFGEWLFGPGYSEGREVAFDAADNFIFGTSFAAPHVAGIVARMLEKNPGLTQSQVEGLLKSTALPVPPSPAPPPYYLPWDERATGAGLVQGAEAVAATPAPLSLSASAEFARRVQHPTARPASVRVVSRVGRVPVEFRVGGFGDPPCTWTIFDVQGRLVRRWISTSSERATWDGSRNDGSNAVSGVYFVHAQGAGHRAIARMVVAR